VADLRLDREVRKAGGCKKRTELADRRTNAHWLGEQDRVSERRVCETSCFFLSDIARARGREKSFV
jgi:hypothetical protein